VSPAVIILFCIAGAPSPAPRDADFAREVFPILERHCLRCHGPEKQRSGLRLDARASALKGGDAFGPAILPGKAADSPLIRLVAGLEEGLVMPPRDDDERTLSNAEIAVLRTWIDGGATWPDGVGASSDDPARHWAFQPLRRPTVRQSEKEPNPIDVFINTRLQKERIRPGPEADRRTLIRRITFDLTGLPPTPEEIDTFERDPETDAYERLVDRLLASPRYGERWARHWLDIAHYGESNGFGMDRPRFNAWPYRDYVIAALNADTPYARFVEEQLAADVLSPDKPWLTPALGFAAAGPFNQSALAEQVDDTECKRIALNLDRDDMVSSIAATFLSVTVHCARCHDHKFDPIPQRDYYRLQASFAGIGRTERGFDQNRLVDARRRELSAWKAALDKDPDASPSSNEDQIALQSHRADWESRLIAEVGNWTILRPAKVDSGGVTLKPQTDGSILAEGPNPEQATYSLAISDIPAGLTALRVEVLPDPTLPGKGPGRAENGNLHLTEIKAFLDSTKNTSRPLKLQNPTADFNQEGWGVATTLDGDPSTGWGIHPAEGQPHAAVFELAEDVRLSPGETLRVVLEQHHGRKHTIGRWRLSSSSRPRPARYTKASAAPDVLAALSVPASQRTPAQEAILSRAQRRAFLDAQLGLLPEPSRVYAIAPDFPAFRNYKPPKGTLAIHVLKRGDVRNPLEAVSPGGLSCLPGLSSELGLASPQDEGARRAALARWITHRDNALAWRSIVNRVWHWHFGRGLVDTPNDLGRMGGRPSHPELLDWLAATFRDEGGSLKALHRQIVTSAVYRRTSRAEPGPQSDSDNRLLARMNRTRLDAEEIRDSLLAVSGRLDPAMGGPPAMQFVFNDPNKEVSPLINYSAFDPDSPASRRRGIYRFLVRNINDPLLEAFDAADPSLSTPRRNVTITPQQSLALWNNRFVLRSCEHLVARLDREATGAASRIDRACRLLWGRSPSAEEAVLLRQYAERHELTNACRLMVNANDFLFVD
jgi:hypothetical protein